MSDVPLAHVCTFTGALDDMRRADQRNHLKVLRVLAESPRFSVFEATANAGIARTMDRLRREGYIVIDNCEPYPWSTAVLTAKGRRAAEAGR